MLNGHASREERSTEQRRWDSPGGLSLNTVASCIDLAVLVSSGARLVSLCQRCEKVSKGRLVGSRFVVPSHPSLHGAFAGALLFLVRLAALFALMPCGEAALSHASQLYTEETTQPITPPLAHTTTTPRSHPTLRIPPREPLSSLPGGGLALLGAFELVDSAPHVGNSVEHRVKAYRLFLLAQVHLPAPAPRLLSFPCKDAKSKARSRAHAHPLPRERKRPVGSSQWWRQGRRSL